MDLKIDISRIVKDHIKTFHDDNNQLAGWDVMLFVGTPLVVSFFLIFSCIQISTEFVNIIISALSIFVGLLFNIIVILFEIVKTEKIRPIKRELVRDVITNISFCILLSLLSIIIALITQVDNIFLKISSNFLTYLLMFEFLLTLFMILKRMYSVFINEIDEIASKDRYDNY